MDMSGSCFLHLALLCYCFFWHPVSSIWLAGVDDFISISGHPLIIDCEIGAYKGENVSWTRIEWEEHPREHKETLLDGDGNDSKILRLTIDQSDSNSDSGLYSCQVDGIKDQKMAYANIITVLARGANVSEGFDANLKCELTPESEDWTDSFIWLKDGLPVDQISSLKDRISLDQGNASLTIKNAKLSDAGIYTCEIRLAGNRLQTFTEKVILQGKPYMVDTVPSDNVFSTTEESLTLKCPVKGAPLPEVFWQRGDDVLEPNSKYVMTDVDGVTSASLEISEPKEEDFGEYVCTAENEMGKVDITFTVVNATLVRIPDQGPKATFRRNGRDTGRALATSPAELLAFFSFVTVPVIVAQSL